MEDFNQYLKDDANEQERAAAEQVRAGLSGLMLERKVAKAAIERQLLLRRRIWRRFAVLAALVLMAGAASLFYLWRGVNAPEQRNIPRQNEVLPPTQPGLQAEQNNTILPKNSPIAKRPVTPQEQSGRPQLRNIQPESDAATSRLIEVLLKMTVNNPPSKNTAAEWWLRSVRLLQDNKPEQAKPFILEHAATDGSGDAHWLLGIALLEEGKLDDAASIFEKIANDPNNPRQQDAVWALEALR